VKPRIFQYLPLCMFLAACGPTASRSPADAITFDTAKRLDDFDFAASGDGMTLFESLQIGSFD